MKARVAIVVSSFPRLSETFIVNKFLGLLERGWDVHVVCGTSLETEWVRFEQLRQGATRLQKRVHVTWLHRPRWLAACLVPFAFLRCLLVGPTRTCMYVARGWRLFGVRVLRHLYLDAELICLNPAIVHFEFGSLAVQRMHLRKLLGCRIVVSFRGYDLNYVGLQTPDYYDAVWPAADGLHFLGQDLWHRAQKRHCDPTRSHTIITPAIRADFFDGGALSEPPEKAADQVLRILGVGRLMWAKGYEFALLAIRLLVDAGVVCRYRIVGGGVHLGAILLARKQLGLEGVVGLLGPRSREDVRNEMRNADVLLHAAVSEGFSNVVIEAQAMRLPVVTTDADGLAENVADGETGFVVPRRHPSALAERLRQLAVDPELRKRMGEAGRRRVLKHFQLEGQVAAFENLYARVLTCRGQEEGGTENGVQGPRVR
jgi:colanic acid/amylovoran biosynthesis glycosyltransferase